MPLAIQEAFDGPRRLVPAYADTNGWDFKRYPPPGWGWFWERAVSVVVFNTGVGRQVCDLAQRGYRWDMDLGGAQPEWIATPEGIAIDLPGAIGGYPATLEVARTHGYTDANRFTIFNRFVGDGAGVSSYLYGERDGANKPHIAYWSATTGEMRGVRPGVYFFITNGTTVRNGVTSDICYVKSGSDSPDNGHRVYVNGEEPGLSSSSAYTYTDTALQHVIGARHTTGCLNGRIFCNYILDGTITFEQYKLLHVDPYGPVTPPFLISVKSTAAAGGTILPHMMHLAA